MAQLEMNESSTDPKTTDLGSAVDHNASNRRKDPADWVTADEPMTGAQASYLETLCQEADEPFSVDLTKAQASQRIDKLRHETGKAASA